MLNPKYFLKDDLPYDFFSLTGSGLYALVVGLLIIANQKLGVIAAILPLLVWFAFVDKRNCLYLLLALAPFHSSPFLSNNFLNIPGAKPFALLSVFTLLICFYHGGQLFFQPGKTRRKVIIYLGVYFAFFSLAAFRSLSFSQLFHMLDPIRFDGSSTKYLLSYYVKPSLLLVSFIYILNHITTQKDIERIFTFLCVVLGMISIVVVSLSLSHGLIFMKSRVATTQIWSAYFGLHYNSIGSFYVVLGPLVIVPAIKKRFWGVLNWCLALVAVALLQSRSSFLLFVFGSFLMLFILGKKKELVFLLSIFLLLSLYYLPGFMLKTFQTGLESGNLDRIFTGRIDSIWIPLLSEWLGNPKLLLFGNGLFSMMTSSVFLKGIILDTHTAHNAFFEFFLDNGIILLFLLIFFIAKFLKLAWYKVRVNNSDMGWALLISIICYLIGTITGQKIYPSHHTMFLFSVIALLINYLRLNKPVLSPTGAIIKPGTRDI